MRGKRKSHDSDVGSDTDESVDPVSDSDVVFERARGPQRAINETPGVLMRNNPAFELRDVRQVYQVAQDAKIKHFGNNRTQYLLDSSNVENCSFLVNKKDGPAKRSAHIVYQEYHLQLLALHSIGDHGIPVYIDKKFNLTNGFAVVMVFQHPWLVSKTKGTSFLVVGPFMLTDYREEECYERFAYWLHFQLSKIKNFEKLRRFRIITDDEAGLYNPFIKIFGAVHVKGIVDELDFESLKSSES